SLHHQAEHQQQDGKENGPKGRLPPTVEEGIQTGLDTVPQGFRVNGGVSTHRVPPFLGSKVFEKKNRRAKLPLCPSERCEKLLGNFGDNTGAHGTAALADSEAQALLDGD